MNRETDTLEGWKGSRRNTRKAKSWSSAFYTVSQRKIFEALRGRCSVRFLPLTQDCEGEKCERITLIPFISPSRRYVFDRRVEKLMISFIDFGFCVSRHGQRVQHVQGCNPRPCTALYWMRIFKDFWNVFPFSSMITIGRDECWMSPCWSDVWVELCRKYTLKRDEWSF